jgi:hypothetical protein
LFLTDAALLNDLADTLQKPEGTLQLFWQNILPQEHLKAYQWLVSTMLRKGFLLTQVVGWDMGQFYERDLTLYFTLRRGAALQPVDDRLLGTMDVRKEVEELQVLSVGGVFQDPAGTAGQVGSGAYDTSGDVFVWPDSSTSNDPPGPGLGNPATDW